MLRSTIRCLRVMGLISSSVEKAVKIPIFGKKWAGGSPGGSRPDFTGKFEAHFKPHNQRNTTFIRSAHKCGTNVTSIRCNQRRFHWLYDLRRREDSSLRQKCENKLDVIWSTRNNGQIFCGFQGRFGRWRRHGEIRTHRLEVEIDSS